MIGLRLSLALMRIPRLFASLLLLPLLMSIVLITIQLWLTQFAMVSITQSPELIEKRIQYTQKHNLIRQLVYGKGDRLDPIRVCRWKTQEDPITRTSFEAPPENPGCQPDRLDIAIHTSSPDSFSVEGYVPLFEGNFERLHICQKACLPDVIIHPDQYNPRIDMLSLPAVLLTHQTLYGESAAEKYLEFYREKYSLIERVGTHFFHAPGFASPIQMTNIAYESGLLFSIATIVIVGLWLAIKSHRKVLDYFSKSGALLPMVAALGKSEFYGAIWILTIARVSAFLLASIPVTYLVFQKTGSSEDWSGFFTKDLGHFIIWILALTLSFGLAAVIASVADLRHRHHFFSFFYRYIPLGFAVLGSLAWIFSFILSEHGGFIRNVITALPVIGMGPMILVPLCEPPLNVLALHTFLTLTIIIFILRTNARWFAAHLEEL